MVVPSMLYPFTMFIRSVVAEVYPLTNSIRRSGTEADQSASLWRYIQRGRHEIWIWGAGTFPTPLLGYIVRSYPYYPKPVQMILEVRFITLMGKQICAIDRPRYLMHLNGIVPNIFLYPQLFSGEVLDFAAAPPS